MTQVTQLTAGGKPAAYLLIGDKVEVTIPVTRDGTRITRSYTTNAAPYRVITNKTPSLETGTTRDDTRITMLRAIPSAYALIGDKTESTEFTIPASDDYHVYVSWGDTSDVELQLTDTYYPLATFAGSVRVLVSATDGYTLGSTLTSKAPISSGATPVNAVDTYTVTASFSTSLVGLLIVGTDTYTPVATDDSGSGPEKADLVVSSDTYTPVLTWGWRRVIETTERRTGSDTYTPVATFSAVLTAYNTDVDQITYVIRPMGYIGFKFV